MLCRAKGDIVRSERADTFPFHPVGAMIRQVGSDEIDSAGSGRWSKDSGDPGEMGGHDDFGSI